MVATLNNTNYLKSCKHTDADKDTPIHKRSTHDHYLHDSCLIYGVLFTQKRRLWMLEMLSCSDHNMNGDKQVEIR